MSLLHRAKVFLKQQRNNFKLYYLVQDYPSTFFQIKEVIDEDGVKDYIPILIPPFKHYKVNQ